MPFVHDRQGKPAHTLQIKPPSEFEEAVYNNIGVSFYKMGKPALASKFMRQALDQLQIPKYPKPKGSVSPRFGLMMITSRVFFQETGT